MEIIFKETQNILVYLKLFSGMEMQEITSPLDSP